jgi:hypothetical protein
MVLPDSLTFDFTVEKEIYSQERVILTANPLLPLLYHHWVTYDLRGHLLNLHVPR